MPYKYRRAHTTVQTLPAVPIPHVVIVSPGTAITAAKRG